VAAGGVVWRTVNRRHGDHAPLTHDSLRAVFRRANAKLSTNWTMHDLRHTCAIRMVRDNRLTLRDVDTILATPTCPPRRSTGNLGNCVTRAPRRRICCAVGVLRSGRPRDGHGL
jgi:hypothetical protein